MWPIPGADKVGKAVFDGAVKRVEQAKKDGTLTPWQEGREKALAKTAMKAAFILNPIGTSIELYKTFKEIREENKK